MGLFSRKARPGPSVPPGVRAYAIGDVHGRADLLADLLARIRADAAARPAAETLVILLGDLIDRGPDSAATVALAMRPLGWARTIALKGNHEDAMAGALDGDTRTLGVWLRNGGRAALASWGIDPAIADDPQATAGEVTAAIAAAIPPAQRAWLAARPLHFRLGDYYFVHAGVKPGVPLDRQTRRDALWIRDEFLESRRDHGAVVVHGHSITVEIEDLPNRIGLDTGAYATGRLTALGLEGDRRWFLQTGD